MKSEAPRPTKFWVVVQGTKSGESRCYDLSTHQIDEARTVARNVLRMEPRGASSKVFDSPPTQDRIKFPDFIRTEFGILPVIL
jgi:hypothetical protein